MTPGPIDVAILDYRLPETLEVPDDEALATFDLSLTRHCIALSNPPLSGTVQLSAYAEDPRLKSYWEECLKHGTRGKLVQKDGNSDKEVVAFVRLCLEHRDYIKPLEKLDKAGLLSSRVAYLGGGMQEQMHEVHALAEQLRSRWGIISDDTRSAIRKNYFDVTTDGECEVVIAIKASGQSTPTSHS